MERGRTQDCVCSLPQENGAGSQIPQRQSDLVLVESDGKTEFVLINVGLISVQSFPQQLTMT